MQSWGAGSSGQLGNSNSDDAILYPIDVPIFNGFTTICGGGSHTISFNENEQEILICGNNDNKQLTLSENKQIFTPEIVKLNIKITALSLGWVGELK